MSNYRTPNPAPGFAKKPDYKMLISSPTTSASATDGELTFAKSDKAILLSEGNYPSVVYFPRTDVNLHTLERTDTSSFCPFKGTASYWRAAKSDNKTPENIDICWSYEDPFDEASAIGSYIAFYADRVTVTSS